MLPVNPHAVEPQWGDEADQGHRGDSGIPEEQRRDLLLVGISDGLSGLVWLEEIGRRVGQHALVLGRVSHCVLIFAGTCKIGQFESFGMSGADVMRLS